MHKIILLVLLFFAFLFRVYRLDTIPSFHADETDFANNAYSILHDGRDQNGRFMPLGTISAGDYRPAGYIYLAALSIKIFGFNEFATRLPSVFFSLLTVLIVYALSYHISGQRSIALFSAAFLSFSFWHITLTREASEKTVALFFVTLGLWSFIKLLNTKKKIWLLVSFLGFFLSLYIYYSPRAFLIVFLPFVWLITRKSLTAPFTRYVPIFCLVLVGASLFVSLFATSTSNERLRQLSIFNTPYTKAVLEEQIREDGVGTNVLRTRVFHNKVVNYFFTVSKNYFEYFSANFLFFIGGYPHRVNVPHVGLINIFEAPLIFIGLSYLLRKSFKKECNRERILILWLITSFLPAAFTFDEIPNVYRTSLALPIFSLSSALGLGIALRRVFRQRRIVFLFIVWIVFYIWDIAYFAHQFLVHAPRWQSQYRNYAQKELAFLLNGSYSNASKIFVPNLYGGVEQTFRFYLKSFPWESERNHISDAIEYTKEQCPFPLMVEEDETINTSQYIFVNSPECRKILPEKVVIEKTVLWKNNVPAYDIILGGQEYRFEPQSSAEK